MRNIGAPVNDDQKLWQAGRQQEHQLTSLSHFILFAVKAARGSQGLWLTQLSFTSLPH